VVAALTALGNVTPQLKLHIHGALNVEQIRPLKNKSVAKLFIFNIRNTHFGDKTK
jgi:hypothetical protein